MKVGVWVTRNGVSICVWTLSRSVSALNSMETGQGKWNRTLSPQHQSLRTGVHDSRPSKWRKSISRAHLPPQRTQPPLVHLAFSLGLASSLTPISAPPILVCLEFFFLTSSSSSLTPSLPPTPSSNSSFNNSKQTSIRLRASSRSPGDRTVWLNVIDVVSYVGGVSSWFLVRARDGRPSLSL